MKWVFWIRKLQPSFYQFSLSFTFFWWAEGLLTYCDMEGVWVHDMFSFYKFWWVYFLLHLCSSLDKQRVKFLWCVMCNLSLTQKISCYFYIEFLGILSSLRIFTTCAVIVVAFRAWFWWFAIKKSGSVNIVFVYVNEVLSQKAEKKMNSPFGLYMLVLHKILSSYTIEAELAFILSANVFCFSSFSSFILTVVWEITGILC